MRIEKIREMEWTKILELGKIPARIVVLLFIISSMLLFMTPEMMNVLQLGDFKKEFGKYIGIGFVASASLLIVMIVGWLIKMVKNWWYTKGYKRALMDNLFSLDSYEQSVLREFYLNGSQTLKLPFRNPTVAGLISKGILCQVGTHGDMAYRDIVFNFKINKLIRNEITSDVIGLPRPDLNSYTKEEILMLENLRPAWLTKNFY